MTDTSQTMSKMAAQFTAFIVKTLKNEVIDFIRENAQVWKNEMPFSEFPDGKMEEYADEPAAEVIDTIGAAFKAAGYAFGIKDELLSDSLEKLDDETRNVILLTVGLDMSDREAGETLGIETRTVNNMRHRGVAILKRNYGRKM